MHLILFGNLTAWVFLQPLNKDIISMSHLLVADDYKAIINAQACFTPPLPEHNCQIVYRDFLSEKSCPVFTAAANSNQGQGYAYKARQIPARPIGIWTEGDNESQSTSSICQLMG